MCQSKKDKSFRTENWERKLLMRLRQQRKDRGKCAVVLEVSSTAVQLRVLGKNEVVVNFQKGGDTPSD